jgi:hypothetical protein
LGLGLAQPKRVHLVEIDLLIFAFFFRFWDGFLSDFLFFDAKTTGKLHDSAIKHIKNARQCVFGA